MNPIPPVSELKVPRSYYSYIGTDDPRQRHSGTMFLEFILAIVFAGLESRLFLGLCNCHFALSVRGVLFVEGVVWFVIAPYVINLVSKDDLPVPFVTGIKLSIKGRGEYSIAVTPWNQGVIFLSDVIYILMEHKLFSWKISSCGPRNTSCSPRTMWMAPVTLSSILMYSLILRSTAVYFWLGTNWSIFSRNTSFSPFSTRTVPVNLSSIFTHSFYFKAAAVRLFPTNSSLGLKNRSCSPRSMRMAPETLSSILTYSFTLRSMAVCVQPTNLSISVRNTSLGPFSTLTDSKF